MQQFTVQKKVRQEPMYFGLKQRAFYVYLVLFLISVFFLIGGFSFMRFTTVICFLGGVYAALLFAQNFDFNQSLPVLPKILINR